MKILTYILAFTVLFLSVKPGIDSISFSSDTQHSCCSNDKCSPIAEKKNSDNQNNDKESNSCNPFQMCSNCVLVCIEIPFQYFKKIETPSKHIFEYHSDMTSQFIGDFWQPPKIV